MNSNFTPSEQQQAVIDWALTGRGSLNLIARAGCGKSSTLLLVVQALYAQAQKSRRFVSVFLGAFNRPIAAELGAKLQAANIPPRVAKAGTMHSAGFTAWRRANGWADFEITDAKLWRWIERGSKDGQALYGAFIKSLVSLAKQSGIGIFCDLRDFNAWAELVEHHGLADNLLEDADPAEGIKLAMEALAWSNSLAREVLDFDDMIYLPLLFNARPYQYDWVMIDEAQDTNAVRRALALAMLKPGGRLIAVGDDRQAIYGFTGADSNAMDLLRQELGSAVLPLNVTYRCPRVVVEVAKRLGGVSDLEAHRDAPSGDLLTINLADLDYSKLTPQDAVLCRVNAPLVSAAYACIRRGIAARVEGKDIAAGLVALAKKWRVKSLSAFDTRLHGWYERELTKLQKQGKNAQAALLDDKYQCMLSLMIAVRDQFGERATVDDLVALIEKLFGLERESDRNAPPALVFCSIHKAKGKEWPTVYILGANAYQPSPWARKEWEQLQESNLAYVAATRAQRKLVYVDVEIHKGD